MQSKPGPQQRGSGITAQSSWEARGDTQTPGASASGPQAWAGHRHLHPGPVFSVAWWVLHLVDALAPTATTTVSSATCEMLALLFWTLGARCLVHIASHSSSELITQVGPFHNCKSPEPHRVDGFPCSFGFKLHAQQAQDLWVNPNPKEPGIE